MLSACSPRFADHPRRSAIQVDAAHSFYRFSIEPMPILRASAATARKDADWPAARFHFTEALIRSTTILG
jgi:hypothetical protein